ncbi:MAG TPA: hypothetical protein ENJ50_06515 [Planctomycetaceae bacterium]|nr:hypothetical protein [Planctomycetaceae bacterium]
MTAAFVQQEATVSQEEILSFEMPVPPIGLPVLWYSTGFDDSRRRQIGFVRYVSARNIGITLPGGQKVDAVRHVDDPKLRLNPEQRETGAWAFTPDYIATLERLEGYSAEIADLKSRLSKLETKYRVQVEGEKKKSGRPKGAKDSKPRALNPKLKAMHGLRQAISKKDPDFTGRSWESMVARAKDLNVIEPWESEDQVVTRFAKDYDDAPPLPMDTAGD